MDYAKYFKKDLDGNYNLHFLNKDRLTVPQIKEIFSVYGNVISVNVTKEEGGLRFVKYKTMQETISCLEGLQNSKIQLLPEKSKMNRKTNRTDSSQQQAPMENAFQKSFNSNQQSNSNSIYDENLSNRRSFARRTFDGDNECSNFSDTNSMHGHKPILHITKDNEHSSSVFDGKSSLPSKSHASMESGSLNSTMDYEKYYRQLKDGGYSVHFINKKDYSLEKIKELFSCYGNVTYVYGKGNNTGLKFVRYEKLEEVIKCLKGLQSNGLIALLPQKDKISEAKTTDQNDSNQWQAAKMEDISQKMFSKKYNSNSSHNDNGGQEKFAECGEKLIHNTRTSDWNKYESTDNFSSNTFSNSRQDYNVNESKYKHTGPQMFNEKYSASRQQNPISNEDYNQARKKQQETKVYPLKTETNIKMDRNMQINTHDHKMPALVSSTEMKLKECDVMSNSSLSNEIKNSSKIVIIPMQEIIVANIHVKYGVHYILHLFEKYSPISATLVKTIPETNIRYCHIYFKSVEDAVAVEEEFDNFDLFGRNLIVLRKSRLIDETSCK